MRTQTLIISLALIGPAACRPTPVDPQSQVARRPPAAKGSEVAPPAVRSDDLLDELLVFSIDGMKKVNGAL
jgi:hypothetical protein